MNKRLLDIVSAMTVTTLMVNTGGANNYTKEVNKTSIETKGLNDSKSSFEIKGNTFLKDTEQLIAEKKRQEEEARKAEEERLKQEEERRIQEEEARKAEEERLARTPHYNPYDLTEKSNLTTDKAREMLNGSALQAAAGAYVYAEEVYGVNSIFLMSLTSHESWHGRSSLAINNNNIGGVKSSNGGWAYFSDWGECIMYIAKFISNSYLREGGVYYNGKSIWAVNINYCADSTPWADMINSIANDLLAKI